MGKSKELVVADLVEGMVSRLQEVTPAAIDEAMVLSAQQRGAVISGLATARQGLEKVILGLKGEYIAPTRNRAAAVPAGPSAR